MRVRISFTRRTRRKARGFTYLVMAGTAALILAGVPLPRIAAVPLAAAIIVLAAVRG